MEVAFIIAALSLGFASGFHCLGMCGPIAITMGFNKKQHFNFQLQNISYQLGRIFTYTFLGALAGIIGEGFNLAGLQKYLSIFAGTLLIIMALFSIGGDFTSKITLINKALLNVKLALGKQLQKTQLSSRFMTGILNGFLPCGMVYMALTASLAAGGIVKSALFMTFFGLGTFPFMFIAVAFGQLMSVAVRNAFLKVIPFLMLILGILFILRGLELGIPYVSPKKEVLKVEKHMHRKGADKENCH